MQDLSAALYMSVLKMGKFVGELKLDEIYNL